MNEKLPKKRLENLVDKEINRLQKKEPDFEPATQPLESLDLTYILPLCDPNDIVSVAAQYGFMITVCNDWADLGHGLIVRPYADGEWFTPKEEVRRILDEYQNLNHGMCPECKKIVYNTSFGDTEE